MPNFMAYILLLSPKLCKTLEKVYAYSMELGILAVIALVLGAGVTGGLLNAWSCHRRLLAIEENLKIVLGAIDDRINMLQKIVIRQDKSEAAKVRWSKKDREAEEIEKMLTVKPLDNGIMPAAWDPRTWGKSEH